MHILIKNIWLYIQCVKKNLDYYVPSHDVLSNSNVIATSEIFCSFLVLGFLAFFTGFGSRHALAFWAFLGFFNVYCLRVNLSVALVAMVNSTGSDSTSLNSTECKEDLPANTTTTSTVRRQCFFFHSYCTFFPPRWIGFECGNRKMLIVLKWCV